MCFISNKGNILKKLVLFINRHSFIYNLHSRRIINTIFKQTNTNRKLTRTHTSTVRETEIEREGEGGRDGIEKHLRLVDE